MRGRRGCIFVVKASTSGREAVNEHEKPDQVETPIERVGEAIVASLCAGGVDHLFFT